MFAQGGVPLRGHLPGVSPVTRATGEPGAAPISASIGSATNSQIAVGTDIRQHAVYLTVALSSGDPAALEQVARQIRFQPLPPPVDAAGADFPNLIGREAQVAAAQTALASRRAVSAFGPDGIGKTVFLQHLANRDGGGFRHGLALLETGGRRWQDVAQEVVQSFFEAEIPVYLGPAQLRRLLGRIDALVLLDDVAPTADIGQLRGILAKACLVVAGAERQLPGVSRAIRLEGLDDAGC